MTTHKADILVVDDQPDNVRLLSTILTQHDYKVRKALNGSMALNAVNSAHPDIILLDINMPGMDGYEVCRTLKSNPETAGIPIIFLSALDEITDKVHAFQAGGADYITKPFQVEEVLARLELQLTLKHQQSALAEKNLQLEQEIFQRRQTQEILQQSRAVLASVLNSSQDGVAALQAVRSDKGMIEDFQWIVLNPIAAKLIGKTKETLIGQNALQVLPNSVNEEQIRQLFNWFVEVVETGKLLEQEFCHTEENKQTWFHITAVKLGDGFAVTFRDITTQKQLILALEEANQTLEHQKYQLMEQNDQLEVEANHREQVIQELTATEKALREAESKYRNIFENAIEGIFQCTPDHRYISANPALARIYGYDSPEELMEFVTDIEEQIYVQPKRLAELSAYMQIYQSVLDVESQVYRKDGSIIWVAENIHRINDETGKLLYYEGTVTDITERRQAEEGLRREYQRAERLLLNILPQPVAERLKRGQRTIADSFSGVSVMFADVVNFTSLSTRIAPVELVELLNQIFSAFDHLAEQYGLEKIKTVGDEYMVAGGLPLARPDHAEAIANMAIEMQDIITQFRSDRGEPFQLRIGINSGPVVAGVIGTKKFGYDLWGDTVNVASRMQSQGEPGRIQVTEVFHSLLRHKYRFEKRGTLTIKGRGEMTTYWLLGHL
jgi:PAS domain S-box-containing protein